MKQLRNSLFNMLLVFTSSIFFAQDSTNIKVDSACVNCDTLVLTAIDISEDVNRFSTKNDEIILLLYDYSDSSKLGSPFLIEKIVFDKNTTEKKLLIRELPKNTLLFLIEEDSFKTLEQIEPIFRVYFKEIIALQKHKSIKNLRKYLGDDDLLYSTILNKNFSSIKMKGMHMLIKFEYDLLLKKRIQ